MYLTHRIKLSMVVSLTGVVTIFLGFLSFVTDVAAAANKVDICHVTNVPQAGDGRIISIADPAWPAHEKHGDKMMYDPAVTDNEDGTCHVAQLPDAVDEEVTTPVDTPVTINVLANDIYFDPVIVSLQVGPSHGLVGPWVDGTITYYPGPGFFGTDSFTYQICNAIVECDTATVTIIVGP